MKFFPRRLLFIVCLALAISKSFAGWDPLVISYAKTFDTPYHDGYLSSLAATCRLQKISYEEMMVPVETWKIFAGNLEKGFLDVGVALQRDHQDRIIRAPLAIFLPGTFGNVDTTMTNRWMDSLIKLGYHVVTLPNPFGTDFVSKVPIAKLGTITVEGQDLYLIVREIFKKLRYKHALNGTVRLIGVSLGGFFGAIITALDAEHPNPIITTDLTVFAPPFHVGRGIDRLDEVVEEFRDPFQEMGLINMYFKFRRVCNLEDPSNPGQEILFDAKGLVAFPGFYNGLMKSVSVYDKVRGLHYIPEEENAFSQWKKRFKFATYYEDLNPEGQKLVRGKEGHIYYWLSRAYKAGGPSVRILTTTDDFFNDPGVWGTMDSNPLVGTELYDLMLDQQEWERIRKDVIVLNYGGHYGFREKPWFENLIRLSFGSKKDRVLRNIKFTELHRNRLAEEKETPVAYESLLNPLR